MFPCFLTQKPFQTRKQVNLFQHGNHLKHGNYLLSPLMEFQKKIGRRIPIIKNLPAFDTMPDKVTPHNLRFYKLCNLVNTLGLAVHSTWVSLFFYLQAYEMAYINLISVAVYAFSIVINRKGYHLLSASIMVCEIIVHQLIAVRMFGWGAGFQYYLIVIGLFPFLMPKGKWGLKGGLLAACLIAYLFMNFWLKDVQPYYIISESFLTYFSISNIIFSFVSMSISGAYFNNAMHETEKQLEKISDELVESEKKATLGKLATEMAHEIQNPLNFVNNFSELNEELLHDLKTELETNGNTDEAKNLMNDLLSNSERINTNGKRVSNIVLALQEQVKKDNQ